MRGGRRFDARSDGIMRLITKSGHAMTAIEQPDTTPLDPRLYVDPDGMAHEQAAIFARSWQLAGHVANTRRYER